MFCQNCGAEISDKAVVCLKCGVPVADKPIAAGGQAVNHMVGAILSTLCCCPPCGIVAIVKAAQVNTKLAQGDVAGAEDAARSAKMWILVSVVLGLVHTLIQLIAFFVAAE